MRKFIAALVFVVSVSVFAAETADPVSVFLNRQEEPLQTYLGTRHMEARGLGQFGWLDISAELSANGFYYEVISEGGSSFIRKEVLKPFLEGEKAVVGSSLAKFTLSNYEFKAGKGGPARNASSIAGAGGEPGGLIALRMSPRRKEAILIDGHLFVRPDGDLERAEGKLAKSPSRLTWGERVVLQYGRVSGVRVPVEIRSSARLIPVGSRGDMVVKYSYDQVNGRAIER